VMGNDPSLGQGRKNHFDTTVNARIDGLTVTAAVVGGGIYLNGFVENLEITNNRIVSNQGNEGGGIRVGNASLILDGVPVDAQNDNLLIAHNQISQNGTLGAAGGGVAVFTGADGYEISDNRICGNFAQADGAGIGHLGLSDGGLIQGNQILFNQSFAQGTNVSGGGIFVGGIGGTLSLSPGSGSVAIDGNLIQGNNAGAGDGAGIRAEIVNGQDVADNLGDDTQWHLLEIINNTIVNNVVALVRILDALPVLISCSRRSLRHDVYQRD
jgi:hypothetical protein